MATIKDYRKQKEKEKVAYNYFTRQGYSPEASAGIVGNLVYESGLNTSAEGDIGYKGGSSFGIAQFRGDRLSNLKKRYGNNWRDFNNQLDFVRHELETTHSKAGNILKNTRDVYEAGQAFSDLYEVPAKKYKNNKDRQNKVNSLYSSLVGGSLTPIADEEIRKANEYFQYQPTTDVKDLPISENSTILADNSEEKDKDLEEVEQQTKEYNFLQEYQNIVAQQEQPQQIEQPVVQEQAPQQNLEDIYNQVSNFVDTPIAQQGKKVFVDSKNDPKYKSYQDSLNLYQGTQRTLQELNSKELAKEGDTKIGMISAKDLNKENKESNVGFGNNYKKEGNWFLTYDKELNLKDAKNYLNSAKIKPEKFHKSENGDMYYRPIYKKPEQIVEVLNREKLKEASNLSQRSLVDIEQENINNNVNIPNQFIQPKYWDIQDNVNQNFGGTQTNYKVTPETADYMLQQLAPNPYNSRVVTPHYQTGGVIKDNNGYWNPNNWGKAVEIDSPQITMRGVSQPLVGISNQTGEKKLMLPNNDYNFSGTKQVTEYPLTNNEQKFLKYIAKIR